MKIVAISDTHGQHKGLRELPPGDVLVVAGDVTNDAGRKELREFLQWLESQPHKNKILIAGNHDWAFEKWPDLAQQMVKEVAPSVTYLQDSGCEIDGVKFWGSPVQPTFLDWAFNRDRGEDIQRHWDMIPDDTNVLVTHGPAAGRLDRVGFDISAKNQARAGCQNLADTIESRLKNLRCHIFGHLHLQGGQKETYKDCVYVNAAVLNDAYNLCRKPQEIYL